MILVSHIKKIIGHDINIYDRPVILIGNSCSCSEVDQGISRRACFGIVRQVNPVLGTIPGCLDLNKTIYEVVLFVFKFIFQLRQAMNRGYHRKIPVAVILHFARGPQLISINNRYAVLEMQRFNRVNVHTEFTTV